MSYSSSTNFDPVTGLISGVLSTDAVPVPPSSLSVEALSDIVVSAYADGSTAYFAQTRTGGGGGWKLPTASLPQGSHAIAITVNHWPLPVATMTITTAGPGIPFNGSTRRDLLPNDNPRP